MVDISVETTCNVCGKAVEVDYVQGDLVITPCQSCLDDKHTESYDEGYEQGQLDTH